MERHIKRTLFAILALTLLFAGCTSKKKIQSQEKMVAETVSITNLQAITPDTVALQYLSSNANISLNVDGKDFGIKGKLRIKRGEGVQITITPLGLVEAASIEFLPEKIRFINKLFKTYTEVPYSEAKAIGLSGINYKVLEAIFLNHAFLPDGRPACNGLKEFEIEYKGNNVLLSTKQKTAIQYSFLVDKSNGHLVSCNGYSSTGESIKCDYSDFANLGNATFPNDICINFKGDATIRIDFELNRPSNGSFSFSSRSINNTYREQSIGDFIKAIK